MSIGFQVLKTTGIYAEMAIDEIKSVDKVDLVVIYDGETTITENLKPSQWQVITPRALVRPRTLR